MTLMQDGWKKCRGPKLWYVLLAELWPIFCWKHSGIRNLPVQLHDSSLFWQSAEMSALIQCQVWTLAVSDHRWSCSHSAAMKKFQKSVKLCSSPVVKQRQPYSWKQVTACLNLWQTMQGSTGVKVVPRILFELDQAGLLQLLSQPLDVADLLVTLCKKYGFDGLVSTQPLAANVTTVVRWSSMPNSTGIYLLFHLLRPMKVVWACMHVWHFVILLFWLYCGCQLLLDIASRHSKPWVMPCHQYDQHIPCLNLSISICGGKSLTFSKLSYRSSLQHMSTSTSTSAEASAVLVAWWNADAMQVV